MSKQEEKPKHSPGPWDWFTDVEDNSKAIPGDAHNGQSCKLLVASDNQGFAHTVGLSEPTDSANARLIAAAPDLLAACKYALAKMEAAWDDSGVCPEFEPEDLLPLREAIARAEAK
jgi:hypothetical protein